MTCWIASQSDDTIFEPCCASLLPQPLFLRAGGQESQLLHTAMRKLPSRSDKKNDEADSFGSVYDNNRRRQGLPTAFVC